MCPAEPADSGGRGSGSLGPWGRALRSQSHGSIGPMVLGAGGGLAASCMTASTHSAPRAVALHANLHPAARGGRAPAPGPDLPLTPWPHAPPHVPTAANGSELQLVHTPGRCVTPGAWEAAAEPGSVPFTSPRSTSPVPRSRDLDRGTRWDPGDSSGPLRDWDRLPLGQRQRWPWGGAVCECGSQSRPRGRVGQTVWAWSPRVTLQSPGPVGGGGRCHGCWGTAGRARRSPRGPGGCGTEGRAPGCGGASALSSPRTRGWGMSRAVCRRVRRSGPVAQDGARFSREGGLWQTPLLGGAGRRPMGAAGGDGSERLRRRVRARLPADTLAPGHPQAVCGDGGRGGFLC